MQTAALLAPVGEQRVGGDFYVIHRAGPITIAFVCEFGGGGLYDDLGIVALGLNG